MFSRYGYEVYGVGVGRVDVDRDETGSELNLENIIITARKFTTIPNLIRKLIIFFEMLIKVTLKGIQLQPKIIHCHDIIALIFGFVVSLFVKTKLIYDAHELESDMGGRNKLMSFLVLNLERLLWKKVNTLIMVSPSIEKWYHENLGVKYSEVILNSPLTKKINLINQII